MSKSRKWIAAMITALIVGVPLAACSVPASDVPETGLTIMGKETDLRKSYMTSIFEQYESETGNHLEIISVPDGEFEDAVAKRFEEGNMPDLLMHFNNAVLPQLGVSDHFYVLDSESWVDDLTESADAYCRDGEGNLIGLPFWECSVSGCYYNKTLLDSLGLKPASTQTEFDTLCQTLASIGYTPICWPANGCDWMYQFALDPVFADDPETLKRLNSGEIRYADIPAVRDMVQWVADSAERGMFGTDYLETGWDEMSPTLASGKAVMIFIWDTWFQTDFETGGKYTKEDFALMPVFMNTVDGGTYEGGNLNMMMVNKDSAMLSEALGFLDFCATPEHYNKAFDGIPTVSCFKGQTTNIQSDMVTNAMGSIQAKERVSTAVSKVIGYSTDDMDAAFQKLFAHEVDVEGCIQLLDEARLARIGGK